MSRDYLYIRDGTTFPTMAHQINYYLSGVYATVTWIKSGSVTRGRWKDPLTNTAGCIHPCITAYGVVRDFQGSLLRRRAITGYLISGFHLRISECFAPPRVSLTNSFKCSPMPKVGMGMAESHRVAVLRAASEMLGTKL